MHEFPQASVYRFLPLTQITVLCHVLANFVFNTMKISVIISLLVTVVASTPLKFDHLGESIKFLSYPPSLSIPIPPQLLFLVRTCLKSFLMNISLCSSLLIALAVDKVPNGYARDDAYIAICDLPLIHTPVLKLTCRSDTTSLGDIVSCFTRHFCPSQSSTPAVMGGAALN